MHRTTHRLAAGPAFTLIELLVVIGIIVLLLAITLPAIHEVRISGKRVLCASRLHQLTTACTAYLADNGSYPSAPFVNIQGAVIPHLIRISLLNDLRTYLGYQKVDDTAALYRLPAVVRCPFREEMQLPQYDAPLPLPGSPITLTGYQYSAGLDVPQNAAQGHALKLDRIPDVHGRRRGVIWSDAIGWYSGSGLVFLPPTIPPSWAYFHFSRGMAFTGFGLADTSALAGQHIAWTDGSIEWIDVHYLDLDLKHRDKTASYAVGSGGSDFDYHWF